MIICHCLLFIFLLNFLLHSSLSIKGSQSIPTRVMIGYWQTWGTSGNPFIKLRDISMNWDIINVAHALPAQPGSKDGKMKFNLDVPNYNESEFISDIKYLHSKGKKIVLSIGDDNGYFTLVESGAVEQFVSDIKNIIDKFGFDGIDIDLQDHSTDFNQGCDRVIYDFSSPILVQLSNAIKQIVTSYGKDFILSWSPATLCAQLGYSSYGGIDTNCDSRAGSYLPIINKLRNLTTYVHVQLYNSGPIEAPDGIYYFVGNKEGIVALTKMMLDGFYVSSSVSYKQDVRYWFEPLRPDQVIIGVPVSKSAAGNGQISNAELQDAYKELNEKYSPLRGFMAWDINWDKRENNNSFVDENKAFLNKLDNK